MNIGTVARTALRAVAGEPIDNKLLVSKKIIIEIENTPSEASVRLAADLRKVLKSVTMDAAACAGQIHEAGVLLARIPAIDPRRQKGEEPEINGALAPDRNRRPKFDENRWLEEQKLRPSEAVPDGFQRGLIDPLAAISRVALKFGSEHPAWTASGIAEVLQTALGETSPDERSVVQLYLALGYDFVERLKCIEAEVLPQGRWITAAICAYCLKQCITIPAPNCFTNVVDELKFRA